jgi:hypothetical protein
MTMLPSKAGITMKNRNEVREYISVIKHDRGKCQSLVTSVKTNDDTHHNEGFRCLSNGVLRYYQYRDINHDDDVITPSVYFDSIGQMSTDSFDMFLSCLDRQ